MASEGRCHALLISPARNGTTSFLRTVAAEFRDGRRGNDLIVSMPSACGPVGLIDAIHCGLKRGWARPPEPGYVREIHMFRGIEATKPAAIIIDAGDGLALASPEKRKATLDHLLHIGARAGTPFIVAARPSLARRIMEAYNADRHPLAWIFHPVHLDVHIVDEEYLELLDHWEGMLPLMRASDLAQRELALHLYSLCDGKIGVLAGVLRRAAAEAIRSGAERITIGLLDEMGFQPPATFSGFRF